MSLGSWSGTVTFRWIESTKNWWWWMNPTLVFKPFLSQTVFEIIQLTNQFKKIGSRFLACLRVASPGTMNGFFSLSSPVPLRLWWIYQLYLGTPELNSCRFETSYKSINYHLPTDLVTNGHRCHRQIESTETTLLYTSKKEDLLLNLSVSPFQLHEFVFIHLHELRN